MQMHVYQRTQVYESRMLTLAKDNGVDIAEEEAEKTARDLNKAVWQETVKVRRATLPP